MSERWAGLSAIMDPERFKDDAGLQQMQALIAWAVASWQGSAPATAGNVYLPYAHTDFIFP